MHTGDAHGIARRSVRNATLPFELFGVLPAEEAERLKNEPEKIYG
jgi:hypothetical protein